MASSGTLSGTAVASVGAGVLLVYAGIKGKSLLSELQGLIQGKAPSAAAAANPIAAAAPAAAGSASYDSSSALQKLWTDNGGPANTAAFAAAVAMAESSGSASATSPNPDGGTNVGIFQLDTEGVGKGYSVAQLSDANLNTQITIMATAGGVNWQEWGDSVTAAVGYHYTPGSAVP